MAAVLEAPRIWFVTYGFGVNASLRAFPTFPQAADWIRAHVEDEDNKNLPITSVYKSYHLVKGHKDYLP